VLILEGGVAVNQVQGDQRRWDLELRSLNRRRLYQIFPPLDARERLPRELLLERRRYPMWSWKRVAALFWPPAFLVALGIVAWISGKVP